MKSVNPLSTQAASAPQPGALVNDDTTSQCKMLKAHLEAGRRITGLEMLQLYGILHHTGRIWNLRNEPYNMVINTDMTKINGKRIAVYSLPTVSQNP